MAKPKTYDPWDYYAPIRAEAERTKPLRDECDKLFKDMQARGFVGYYYDPHEIYALFSFNKDMFGWVHHNWFPCGNWEAPEAEWDYDYEKGFSTFDDVYKSDVWDEEYDSAMRDKERVANGEPPYWSYSDWLFVSRIKCIPMGKEDWRPLKDGWDLYYHTYEHPLKIKWEQVRKCNSSIVSLI